MFSALLLISVLSVDASSQPAAAAAWQDRLFTPTFLDKLGDTYFIVDCWHNRVLWNRVLDGNIAHWKTLDDTLAGPHSIASDGEIYVVEDTGRHGLRVYRRDGDGFKKTQDIRNITQRPHRVRYDVETKAFYVVAANSQNIYRLVRDGDGLKLAAKKHLDFLGGQYTRSFTIVDGAMYFVSGPGYVHKTEYRDGSYKVLARYHVPAGMGGMNDLFHTEDGWWYLTASYQKAIRVHDLDDLNAGIFENVEAFIGRGATPYYLSRIDGRYYAPLIAERSAIISFVHDTWKISDVQVLCDFGRENKADADRNKLFPK